MVPEHVEGTHAKLERLVTFGVLDEIEPGFLQLPGARASITLADQRS